MARFRGEVLTVDAMLRAADDPHVTSRGGPSIPRHRAADAAASCRVLIEHGDGAEECWRFGILQTVDYYDSALRLGGVVLASGVFADEPDPTGSSEVDAAFAALASYLAERDGWNAPRWADAPSRRTVAWYPSVPAIFRADADRESPDAFRRRGIFITTRSLSRA